MIMINYEFITVDLREIIEHLRYNNLLHEGLQA